MPDQKLIDLARDLFLRAKPHRQIEAEIRAAGHPNFHRRVFYKNGNSPGWIERFAWPKQQCRSPECGSPHVRKGKTPNAVIPASPKFEEFLQCVSPKMKWHWPYQQLLYKKLEAVTNGSTKRLMIFLPPRHGKSELVTVRYAAWRLQQDPSLNIILGSYNQRLANRFSRKIRSVCQDAESRISTSVKSAGQVRTRCVSGRVPPQCEATHHKDPRANTGSTTTFTHASNPPPPSSLSKPVGTKTTLPAASSKRPPTAANNGTSSHCPHSPKRIPVPKSHVHSPGPRTRSSGNTTMLTANLRISASRR
ncbi:MAG: hypothetical protein LC734_10465 [Acidobacteria bacterium]|nr:hypothetical protein [Acidobacteriota bacterium]